MGMGGVDGKKTLAATMSHFLGSLERMLKSSTDSKGVSETVSRTSCGVKNCSFVQPLLFCGRRVHPLLHPPTLIPLPLSFGGSRLHSSDATLPPFTIPTCCAKSKMPSLEQQQQFVPNSGVATSDTDLLHIAGSYTTGIGVAPVRPTFSPQCE